MFKMEWTGSGSCVVFLREYPGCRAVPSGRLHEADTCRVGEEGVAWDVNSSMHVTSLRVISHNQTTHDRQLTHHRSSGVRAGTQSQTVPAGTSSVSWHKMIKVILAQSYTWYQSSYGASAVITQPTFYIQTIGMANLDCATSHSMCSAFQWQTGEVT